MHCEFIKKDVILDLIEEPFNPFDLDRIGAHTVREEMKRVYNEIVGSLSEFGEEGDFYGISDFAVRPEYSGSHFPVPENPYSRQFTVTVLTEGFHKSEYLRALTRVLSRQQETYRAWIDQDFNPGWIQTILITPGLAQVYCTNERESKRLAKVFAAI